MYYRLVKAGLRTIEKVPLQFRDAVIADLTALGLDGSGNPIAIPTTSNETFDEVNAIYAPIDLSGKIL